MPGISIVTLGLVRASRHLTKLICQREGALSGTFSPIFINNM